MRHLLSTTLLGLVGSVSILAVQAKGEEANFVLPVTTDLQRTAFFLDKNATACVVIDASSLRRDDNVIRWTTLDFDAMRKALLPLRKKGKDASVTFQLVYRTFEKHDHEFPQLLRWVLIGFGQETGFRHARCSFSGPPRLAWDTHWAALKEKMSDKADGDEPSTGNDLVTVHPVRTLLSRHLFDNADCVVTIIPPFGEDSDGTLSRETTEAIRRYVAALDLKLTEKGRLYFQIRYKLAAGTDIKEATRKVYEGFYYSAAKEIASALGFETYNVGAGASR